ncbi:hypothetical protein NM208_g10671 [Fusarium decemcellulare]|uniref:Uncharacterized protein n=1 Tax=Fusarium decemcellulare TaxID=57161 RepID=A0ACC1RX12_9HYPO|nr:hypothetical protein NM208_g10671 [Fusarium decemcellulare]
MPDADQPQETADAFDNLIQAVDGWQAFITSLLNRIDALALRVAFSDLNNMTRLQNSYATENDHVILPLMNVNTGQRIDPFPSTLGHLVNLSDPEVARILTELGIPPQTDPTTNKRVLQAATGVVIGKIQ